jgi:hypothetical protein
MYLRVYLNSQCVCARIDVQWHFRIFSTSRTSKTYTSQFNTWLKKNQTTHRKKFTFPFKTFFFEKTVTVKDHVTPSSVCPWHSFTQWRYISQRMHSKTISSKISWPCTWLPQEHLSPNTEWMGQFSPSSERTVQGILLFFAADLATLSKMVQHKKKFFSAGQGS